MESEKYKVRITFITPVLGTVAQPDVMTNHVAKKHEEINGTLPNDELETIPEILENGTTVFHRLDGKPIIYDYHVKAFLKEAGRIFNGLNGLKAIRSKIGNFVFVFPRQIELHVPEDKEITFLERPLRAETAQGPRIALARSEQLPAGTWFDCEIEIFKSQVDDDLIRELMTYGKYQGFLQWRNAGYGRFEFEFLK